MSFSAARMFSRAAAPALSVIIVTVSLSLLFALPWLLWKTSRPRHRPTAAFRVSQIEELLQQIIQAVATHNSAFEREAQRDLAKLARVSKAFWRLSTPLLWKTLDRFQGIQPVLSVLEVALSLDNPDPARRMLLIASLVQSLTLTHMLPDSEEHPYATKLHRLRLASPTPDLPFMPHLRSLNIEIQNNSIDLLETRYLLSPALRELSIHCSDFHTTGTQELVTWIRDLPDLVPDLVGLILNPRLSPWSLGMTDDSWNAINRAVERLAKLRSLKVALDYSLLLPAVYKAPLESLTLLMWTDFAPMIDLPASAMFPTLTSLALTGDTAADRVVLTALRFRAPLLKSVRISPRGNGLAESMENVNALIRTLVEFFPNKLVSLEFAIQCTVEQSHVDLHVLYPYAGLERLELYCTGDLRWDDTAFLELVRAWPRLRVLTLHQCPQCQPTASPHISLSSLALLAKHCRLLETLDISVDLTTAIPPSPLPTPSTNLKQLNFRTGSRRMRETIRPVVEFVVRLWPKALVHSEYYDTHGTPEHHVAKAFDWACRNMRVLGAIPIPKKDPFGDWMGWLFFNDMYHSQKEWAAKHHVP